MNTEAVQMALPYKGKGWVYIPEPGWNKNYRNRVFGSVRLGRYDAEHHRWPVNRKDFTLLRERLASFGHQLVEYRQSMVGTFKCDERCTKALHEECVCSCGGRNHKGKVGKLVGDTTVVVPGELIWAVFQ